MSQWQNSVQLLSDLGLDWSRPLVQCRKTVFVAVALFLDWSFDACGYLVCV
jgi:hypothetical protein